MNFHISDLKDSSFKVIITGYKYDIFRWTFFKYDSHDLNRAYYICTLMKSMIC